MTLSLLLLPITATANTLPERIENFTEQIDYSKALVSYDIRILHSEYPTKLIASESMYPQTSSYPLKDVQLLFSLSQSCTGKLPVSPLITEPLVFTRAICKGTPLSEKWFARSNLIHPGGGTYAARYVDKFPDLYEELEHFMHVKERPLGVVGSMLSRLQTMTPSEVDALISAASMFVQGDDLWLRRGDSYYIFDQETWLPLVDKNELQYNITSGSGTCFVQRGNICWSIKDHSKVWRLSLIALIAFNIVGLFVWFYYRWKTKRQELQSRMLVLQILTHELRTPIASLSMTVEGFRREFEHLPESVYDEFRRLCEDTRRLRQLAEASKDYLQSDKQQLATEWVPSVQEWLDYLLEDYHEHDIKLMISKDFSMKANIYWLGTCIDNLLRNAVKYGVSPIELIVEQNTNCVTISVKDGGNLTAKDWKNLKKPFVSKSGLGLGLTIVESMVERMGGTMRLIGPPTTFILEIPCETDIASS
ncbi:sensor histidine kinase VxrA [Vibrio maerlii]|uniref:sensor histidine kinase VxrA n=1 Tax=Vibrio maerlii TaxID=2231648 RepID=UPI000E3BCE54|nr:sensor histidine kinase VxrA [Vibrio maerlii]